MLHFIMAALKDLFLLNLDFLVVNRNILTCQAYMFQKICVAQELAHIFLCVQKNGQKKMVPISYISPPILLWKARRFIREWGALRRWSITSATLMRSPLTASWSACYRVRCIECGLFSCGFLLCWAASSMASSWAASAQ